MDRNESKHNPNEAASQFQPPGEDDGLTLSPQLKIIWGYRLVLGLVAGIVVLGICSAMLIARARAATEVLATVEFVLQFAGANTGEYPNGTPFSVPEITSVPILNEVYESNDLNRFGTESDFRDAVFVLQSNPELELILLEYQTKLADLRLSPVDRARIEEEFQGRRESITSSRLRLNLRQADRFMPLPPSLASKVLDDILTTWARQAIENRGVLLFDIPVLTERVLTNVVSEFGDYLTSVDVLRSQISRLLEHIALIRSLPGADIVHRNKDRLSLWEARVRLEDILRFEINPLVASLLGVSEPETWEPHLANRIFEIRLDRDEQARRVQAMQESLLTYALKNGTSTIADGGARSDAIGGTGPGGGPAQGMMVGESFLDRLVSMANDPGGSQDLLYRQDLTDRIITESLALSQLDREYAYYEELRRSTMRQVRAPDSEFRNKTATSRGVLLFDNTVNEVTSLIREVTSIYEDISLLNLSPPALMYRITAPFAQRTERSNTGANIPTYGALILIVAMLLTPIGCLARHYITMQEPKSESPSTTDS